MPDALYFEQQLGMLRVIGQLPDGVGHSENGLVRVYWSQDTVLDANDVQIGSRSFGDLAPGAPYAADVLLWHNDFTAGNGFLLAATFDTFTATPSQILAAPATVTDAPTPNLVPSGGGWQTDLFWTSSNFAAVTVDNRGTGTNISDFSAELFISEDTLWDPEDLSAGTVRFSSVAPNEESDQSLYFDLPDGLAPGLYHLIWRIDPDDEVAETRETDNLQVFENITVHSQAALRVLTGPLDNLFNGTRAPEFVFSSLGDDSVFGNDGADTLNGGLDNDLLNGGSDNDILLGDDGDDTLDGGSGVDRMEGGLGNDVYYVDDRRDLVVELEGQGADRVLASEEVRLGGAEIEEVSLLGDRGLRVNGNQYATEIVGNAGSNILIGGGGGDTITGGDGTDYFAFLISDADGATRITDFGGRDQIALDDRLFGLGDGSIDVRAVSQAQIDNALRSGAAQYNGRTGELSVDSDGRGGGGPA